jgi:hypothetical protein
MRFPLVFACCLAILPLAATASDVGVVSAPVQKLRGGDCLATDRMRGWTAIDERHILVDGGRNKYRIEIAPGCSGLGFEHSIGFKGDPIFNRVCGVGDEVIVRDFPCSIETMQLLSNDQYKQALLDRSAEKKARQDAKKAKSS